MDDVQTCPVDEQSELDILFLIEKFDELLKQTDDTEIFAERMLGMVGTLTNARELKLFIYESADNRPLIHATMSKTNGEWVFCLGDADEYKYRRMLESHHHKVIPIPSFNATFCFELNISQRWKGVFYLEYPGLRLVSPKQHLALKKIIWTVGYYFRIILMEKKIDEVEFRLREEKQINNNIRESMTALSKEIYCVNSISNVLGQSYDIQEIFPKIMEITLPLLRAEFGVIFIPDKVQCISFHRSNVRYERRKYRLFDNKNLKTYFDRQISHVQEESKWISIRPLTNSDLGLLSLEDCVKLSPNHSGFEFSLRFGNDVFGLGVVVYSDSQSLKRKTGLFQISLNMLGLSLENISLMKDFERQIKLKSQEILDMEKRQRFLLSCMGQPSAPSSRHGISSGSPIALDRLLDSIERSRKMSLLGELASGVAHQIRNPMNQLVVALHLIQDNKTTETDKAALYNQMVERVETMNRMIKEFVQYTRMPKLNIAPESINLVLKNAIDTFKGWMDMIGVELTTSFDSRLEQTKMDLCLMNQVFHNIIKNALEAIDEKGSLHISTKRLKIKNSPEPKLEFAELEFHDSGPGLSKEEVDQVMMPFYSQKQDGMGLGLAIVDYIVRAHGGGVQINSRPGDGTNVIIYLPVR